MTVFLGTGFAAKYPEGGGNFSVPLQWALGLKRLGVEPVWLEIMPPPPASEGPDRLAKCIRTFRRRMARYGLSENYCLVLLPEKADAHDITHATTVGISKSRLLEMLGGPNTLLNLSYSIHPPFLLSFERRIFCDIDPGEIHYWMPQIEMGQSYHHDFWTIGLNVNHSTCRLPKTKGVKWKTFPPLVDTKLIRPSPRPVKDSFKTIAHWYWESGIEIDGEYPDLSKRATFEKYLPLARELPQIRFELALSLPKEDPDRERLRGLGWKLVDPYRATATPDRYYRYLASATGEFTPTKGVDLPWKTGWISDRAAAFLASGRPVITEDTGCTQWLPDDPGILFVKDRDTARDALTRTVKEWRKLSQQARKAAEGHFDSTITLGRILG